MKTFQLKKIWKIFNVGHDEDETIMLTIMTMLCLIQWKPLYIFTFKYQFIINIWNVQSCFYNSTSSPNPNPHYTYFSLLIHIYAIGLLKNNYSNSNSTQVFFHWRYLISSHWPVQCSIFVYISLQTTAILKYKYFTGRRFWRIHIHLLIDYDIFLIYIWHHVETT